MLKSKLPDQEAFNLIPVLDGLPPMAAYLNATLDQLNLLAVVREHFQDVKLALSAFLDRQKNPVGANDPVRKNLVEMEFKYYLRAYELFWLGWDAIESEIKNRQKSDSSLIESVDKHFPAGPYEAVAFLLELDCEAMLHYALHGGSISAHESYNLLGGVPDANATGKQKKRVDRTLSYAASVSNHDSPDLYLEFCVSAIKKRLRGNTALRSTLKEFQQYKGDRAKTFRRILKTQKVHGEKWQDGIVQSL